MLPLTLDASTKSQTRMGTGACLQGGGGPR